MGIYKAVENVIANVKRNAEAKGGMGILYKKTKAGLKPKREQFHMHSRFVIELKEEYLQEFGFTDKRLSPMAQAVKKFVDGVAKYHKPSPWDGFYRKYKDGRTVYRPSLVFFEVESYIGLFTLFNKEIKTFVTPGNNNGTKKKVKKIVVAKGKKIRKSGRPLADKV